MGRIAISPLRLGGPQTRGQSQRWPANGQNCYITPAFSGVPKQGDIVKGGRQMGRIAISPLRLGGPQARTQSQRCPTSGQNCYITPAFCGGPQTRGQSQRWPTSGQKCYITPAFLGVPKQGDRVKGAPQVGRIATSPLRSWGSPNQGTKSKVPHKWAELLHHPCVLGGPQTRGQSQRWPTSGQNCYITLAFSGVPKQGDKVKGGPQVGGIATSPLRSWGSPHMGTKSKVPHKWAELLHHPCVLGAPNTRGQSQRCPTSGQNCYITPAFLGVPKQRDKVKGGRQMGRIAISLLRLGCPQTRGQSQRCPTNGQNCYITPAFLGVPKQGDKVKGGPQVGTIATSPLRSRGSPNKGTG